MTIDTSGVNTTSARPVTEAVRAVRGRRRRGMSATLPTWTLLFALPGLILYGFVVVWPTLQGAVYAFTDWDGLSTDISFVGFANLEAVFQDPASVRALVNSVVIALVYMVVQNTLGLLLALGVSTRIKSRNFLKVLFFTPAVLTPVVVGYAWQYLLAPNGSINEVLRAVGLGELARPWLGEPGLALASIILVLVWSFAGYSMVIFLAGLQGIPEELNEAAAIDGAGRWRKFISVTFPLLAPAVTINLMLSMIGALKVFDIVWVLTGGGPGGSTHTLSTLMIRESFTFGDFGKGVTLGLLLLGLVLVVSVVQYRALISRELKN